MGHFNKLTPAEAERLSILAEECGEVIQVIGKIQRHGFDSCHPNGGLNNRALLEKELGDVRFAMDFMREGGDIDEDRVGQAMSDKALNIEQYLHHNKHLVSIQECGAIECWACKHIMTQEEHGENDGLCIECGSEIDLDE